MIGLPPARTPGEYALGLVCLGNICRSPTAHVVLDSQVSSTGLAQRVTISSCGTGGWHVGAPMDPRAASTLREAGYDPSRHRARHLDRSWFDTHDLLLAMDGQNLADLGGRSDRVRLFGDFDPHQPGVEVPDPFYGGADGFQSVLTLITRISTHLTTLLAHEVAPFEPPSNGSDRVE